MHLDILSLKCTADIQIDLSTTCWASKSAVLGKGLGWGSVWVVSMQTVSPAKRQVRWSQKLDENRKGKSCMRESWSCTSIKGVDLEEDSSAKDAGKKLVRQEETQV